MLLNIWIFSSDLRNLLNYFPERLAPQAMLMFLFHYEPPSTCFVHSWLYFPRVLWVQVLDFASKDLSYLSVKALCILKILSLAKHIPQIFSPVHLFLSCMILFSFIVFLFLSLKNLSPRKIFLVFCFSPFISLSLFFFHISLSSHLLWFISACGNKVGGNSHFSK